MEMNMTGTKRLAEAILTTAHMDYELPQVDEDLEGEVPFWQSDWCLDICTGLGVDHDAYVDWLKTMQAKTVEKPESGLEDIPF